MKNIILYIGSIFLPDKSAGAQRSLSLCKSFNELGYRVVLIGMNADQPIDMSIIESKGECAGFETFSIPQPKVLKQWIHHSLSISEFVQVVEHYGAKNIHSIVAMEYEAVALLKLSSYCSKNGILLISDAEEWYEHSRLPFPLNIAKDIDTNLRMFIVYPHIIRNMICISRFFEHHYEKKVPHRVYIPGTIDIFDEKWKSIPTYVPNDIFTIGYAGHPGLQFEKERLDWLVRAVEELNIEKVRCRLKIAGVDKEFMDQRLTYNNIPEGIVQYLGRIPHTDCLKMIASCDFSAIVREDKRVTQAGFPTKLSESFGCGTPLITTASSNVREYISEGETGFVCTGYSKDAVKETIRKATKIDREQLIRMHVLLRAKPPLAYHNFTPALKCFIEQIETNN